MYFRGGVVSPEAPSGIDHHGWISKWLANNTNGGLVILKKPAWGQWAHSAEPPSGMFHKDSSGKTAGTPKLTSSIWKINVFATEQKRLKIPPKNRQLSVWLQPIGAAWAGGGVSRRDWVSCGFAQKHSGLNLSAASRSALREHLQEAMMPVSHQVFAIDRWKPQWTVITDHRSTGTLSSTWVIDPAASFFLCHLRCELTA